jgi:hypothetical protein
MPKLNDATAVYLGALTASDVYLGSDLIFTTGGGGGGTNIDWGNTGSAGGGNWPANGNRALLTKIVASNTLSLTQFNMRTTAANGGGVLYKGLVYAADGTGGNPGTLVGASSPTANTAAGAQVLTAACSITVPPGNYWIGYVANGSGAGAGGETDSGGTGTNNAIMMNSGETNYATPSNPATNWAGSPGPYSNVPALWFDGTY